MNLSNKPKLEELPSSKQLLKSTFIAFIVAVIVLVIAILPAEYGVDPTGLGNSLGLKKMGEIKVQLEQESLETSSKPQTLATTNEIPQVEQVLDSANSEVFTYTLKPGQAVEVKLKMKKGAKVQYLWSTQNGNLNFDLHGDGDKGSKNFTSYKKGLDFDSDKGELIAQFDGKHGWFWRNRDNQDVTVNLKVEGEFTGIVKYL